MISFYRRIIIEITVFTCGALVMIFEIIGSRLLSPFIGTSTYVWTSLIGIILASLSLGYWLGGRLADKNPDLKVLASITMTAGGLVALTVLIKDVVLSNIAGSPMGLEAKAVAAAIILFAPASVCLGIVTPFAVRIKMTSLENTGATVGRLYALSTIGSIVGTFGAGFFLLPFVGTIRTLYIIAACLIGLSLSLVPLVITARTIAVGLIFGLGVAASEVTGWMLRQSSDLYDIDTEYSRVQVFRTTDPRTGRPIRALATDPYFVQSAAFLDSDELVLDYSRFYHLIGHFNPAVERTLLIGGAGYSFPKAYLPAYPRARIDVVEIDPRMTDIARRFFRLKDDPRLQIIHEDGRMYARRSDAGIYDAVLMDAFGSLFSVPYHLTTREAVTDFHRVLRDDGIVVFNLGAAISGPASRFLHSELKTYREVFPYVLLFKVNLEYEDARLQNLIIVASKTPLKPAGDDPAIADLLTHRYEAPAMDDVETLTDDLAPVEYYNSIAQQVYLSQK